MQDMTGLFSCYTCQMLHIRMLCANKTFLLNTVVTYEIKLF